MCACTSPSQQGTSEDWKKEIVDAEAAFSQMSMEKGIAEAFLEFAADDAVLMRNNKVVVGIEAIRTRFANANPNPTAKLQWKPDFVDVAASGDLGYTYGGYTFSTTDSLGNVSENTGIFHTVWKRQKDGQWKFVWD